MPRGCGVIQGDGINLTTLSAILAAVLEKGYSAEVRAALPCQRRKPSLHAGGHGCLLTEIALLGCNWMERQGLACRIDRHNC